MKAPVVWVVKAVGSRPDHECILGDGMAKTLFAAGCLGALPAKAVQMRAFENETHYVWRRTDFTITEKRKHVGEMLKKYGFAPCV